ncbi:MAG: family 78 glycoside hydrolase catalytic domain [Acidimicrobiales bacterium]
MTSDSKSGPLVLWQANLVSPQQDFTGSPLLRRVFTLPDQHGALEWATLHISSLGIFEAFLNGCPVTDDVLNPGWSSYQWRLRYRSYDVMPLLKERSVLGVALGNGWYRGRLGWAGQRALYGDRLAVIAQVEMNFEDGHREVLCTDNMWRAGPSSVLTNDLYDGEAIDARLRDLLWLTPEFEEKGWVGVDILPFDSARLVRAGGPPVRRHEHLVPIATLTSPSGHALLDFGQNVTGWTKLHVRGQVGTEVTVAHAEVLEKGELGTRPLRSAKATDTYVLSGHEDVFEPTMTFHGFRYVQIDGWPGPVVPNAVEAVVVHTDLRRIGHFECSHELLNQFHRNVVWGFRGNALDVPTDCPQRDERLGWTGDLAVFAPTAAYLFDVQDFLADWLRDLDAEQEHAGGVVPLVVPNPPSMESFGLSAHGPYAIWGDACIWIPWALWQAYGDLKILEEQFESMAAHLGRVIEKLSPNGLWDQGFQFGDWLDPDAPPDQPWRSKANPGVVATVCLYRSARTVSDVARLIGLEARAEEFAALAERTREAFIECYVRPGGRIKSDAPTVYALAITFGLFEGDLRQAAGDRLAELVRDSGYHVSTGFAGTPYVLDALTLTGHLGEAYRMLLEQSCPSWLYPVTMGATTIWERWDSMLPDGSINPGEMTSFNHYALGAVADWVHRTVGGIAPLEPGYKRVLISPKPGGDITWAKADLEVPQGRIGVDWSLHRDQLSVTASVPHGVSGLVELPGREQVEIFGELGGSTLHLDARIQEK